MSALRKSSIQASVCFVNSSFSILRKPSFFIFSIKAVTIGAVSPTISESNKKTAPLPSFCAGIPVASSSFFAFIKIGILK